MEIVIINKKLHYCKIVLLGVVKTYYVYKNTTNKNTYNYVVLGVFVENLHYYVDNQKHKLYLLDLEDIEKNKRKTKEIQNIKDIVSGYDTNIIYKSKEELRKGVS